MKRRNAEIVALLIPLLTISFAASTIVGGLLELMVPDQVRFWWLVAAFMLFTGASIPADISKECLDGRFPSSMRLTGMLAAVLGAAALLHSVDANPVFELLFASGVAVYAMQPSFKKTSA